MVFSRPNTNRNTIAHPYKPRQVPEAHQHASVMINFRRDDEALLAAALTGFTWSSIGLVEEKKNLIIRWASRTVILVSRVRILQCKCGNLS